MGGGGGVGGGGKVLLEGACFSIPIRLNLWVLRDTTFYKNDEMSWFPVKTFCRHVVQLHRISAVQADITKQTAIRLVANMY